MSKNYSLEDVEALRGKAGISYEEAVSLLEKYEGDVARALIELEKRGQLGASAQNAKFTMDDAIEWVKKLWHKGRTTRVVVERKGEMLINLSAAFLLLMLILGPYSVVVAFILTLISGSSVSLKTEDNKEQTILKGDEAEEAPVEEAQSAEKPAEAPFKTDDDDDFPSITIS